MLQYIVEMGFTSVSLPNTQYSGINVEEKAKLLLGNVLASYTCFTNSSSLTTSSSDARWSRGGGNTFVFESQ
ncbi:hypothetical protein E2C01_001344 [Portunus trituberculatus]|uniref:Uncharacterized protein n=1 Tax=Portunus trituberculatus TaxID=210409 RepID=A0A5B7CJ17_PORTR|nr:hypothetical protein [Portunus trituberculatus]